MLDRPVDLCLPLRRSEFPVHEIQQDSFYFFFILRTSNAAFNFTVLYLSFLLIKFPLRWLGDVMAVVRLRDSSIHLV